MASLRIAAAADELGLVLVEGYEERLVVRRDDAGLLSFDCSFDVSCFRLVGLAVFVSYVGSLLAVEVAVLDGVFSSAFSFVDAGHGYLLPSGGGLPSVRSTRVHASLSSWSPCSSRR